MNNDYLIHYGVLGMKWGIRRYQYKDGTRTPLGKRRERLETTKGSGRGLDSSYSNNTLKAIGSKKGMGNNSYANETLKSISKKGMGNDSYADETLKSISKKGMGNDSYADETINKVFEKKHIDSKFESTEEPKLEIAKNDNKDRPIDSKKAEEIRSKGKYALENMSDANLKRYLSKLSDNEIKAINTRISAENKIRNSIKLQEDLAKEQNRKAYEATQGRFSDAKSIALQSSDLARNMKNLSSRKAQQKIYLNPKELKKLSDEDIIRLTERARIESNYLNATNQTIDKGRKSIDWDKMATVFSVVATGIGIASSISSLKNRGKND